MFGMLTDNLILSNDFWAHQGWKTLTRLRAGSIIDEKLTRSASEQAGTHVWLHRNVRADPDFHRRPDRSRAAKAPRTWPNPRPELVRIQAGFARTAKHARRRNP